MFWTFSEEIGPSRIPGLSTKPVSVQLGQTPTPQYNFYQSKQMLFEFSFSFFLLEGLGSRLTAAREEQVPKEENLQSLLIPVDLYLVPSSQFPHQIRQYFKEFLIQSYLRFNLHINNSKLLRMGLLNSSHNLLGRAIKPFNSKQANSLWQVELISQETQQRVILISEEITLVSSQTSIIIII